MLKKNTLQLQSDGSQTDEALQRAKLFYGSTQETFTEYAQKLAEVSDFLRGPQAQFFLPVAKEGERIGEMNVHSATLAD